MNEFLSIPSLSSVPIKITEYQLPSLVLPFENAIVKTVKDGVAIGLSLVLAYGHLQGPTSYIQYSIPTEQIAAVTDISSIWGTTSRSPRIDLSTLQDSVSAFGALMTIPTLTALHTTSADIVYVPSLSGQSLVDSTFSLTTYRLNKTGVDAEAIL